MKHEDLEQIVEQTITVKNEENVRCLTWHPARVGKHRLLESSVTSSSLSGDHRKHPDSLPGIDASSD